MANSFQRIRRVNQLPTPREVDTLYVVVTPGKADAKLVFIGSDPAAEYGVIDSIAVDQVVEAALDGRSSIYFRNTYTDMVARKPIENGLIYVLDTTDDPMGGTGASGVYLYNKASDSFQNFPGTGGTGPTQVQWAQVLGKPVSTPAQIDKAVTDSHVHANKVVLDRVTEDAQQKLLYRGLPVSEPPTVKFLGSNW